MLVELRDRRVVIRGSHRCQEMGGELSGLCEQELGRQDRSDGSADIYEPIPQEVSEFWTLKRRTLLSP